MKFLREDFGNKVQALTQTMEDLKEDLAEKDQQIRNIQTNIKVGQLKRSVRK